MQYPLVDNTQFEPDEEYIPEPEPEPQLPAWMDGSVRIGIHTSISGSYLNALESAKRLGSNAVQIFSASPRMWQSTNVRVPENDAKAFRARREALGLGPLVIHANYLINLAAKQPMLRTRSIQSSESLRLTARGWAEVRSPVKKRARRVKTCANVAMNMAPSPVGRGARDGSICRCCATPA